MSCFTYRQELGIGLLATTARDRLVAALTQKVLWVGQSFGTADAERMEQRRLSL